MSRIAYVNGRYLPLATASVNIEDRGYQFSDGVYEVCEVRGGRLVDERRHMARLQFSLSELRIAMPMKPAALSVVLHEVVRRNRVRWGIVYLQISRGVSRRDHAFPPAGTAPAIVVTARKVEENLMTVPVAITAFSSRDIDAMGMKQMSDVSLFTPSLHFINQIGGGLIIAKIVVQEAELKVNIWIIRSHRGRRP